MKTISEILLEKRKSAPDLEKVLIDFYTDLKSNYKILKKMGEVLSFGFEGMLDSDYTITSNDAIKIYDENIDEWECYFQEEHGSLNNFVDFYLPFLDFNSLNEIKIYAVWKVYRLFTEQYDKEYNHQLLPYLHDRLKKSDNRFEKYVIDYYISDFKNDSDRLCEMETVLYYGSGVIDALKELDKIEKLLHLYSDDIEEVLIRVFGSIDKVTESILGNNTVLSLSKIRDYRLILADFVRIAFRKVSNDLFTEINRKKLHV